MESFNGTPIVAGVSSRGYETWRRYNRAEDVVGLFVAGSRVWSHDESSAQEVPAVFILDREQDGKFTLRVHGSGGTGDETYRFDDAFVDGMLNRPARTEEDPIFGGKKHALFMLCMGGGGHRKWTVPMEAMHDMVRTFQPLLAPPVMNKEVDLDRLRWVAHRAGLNPLEGAINDELTINRAASDITLLRALLQSSAKLWDRTLAVEHGDESQAEPGWKWNRHARCWESRQLSGSYLTPIVISRVQAGWKRSDHNPSATTYTSALSAMLADPKEESE